MRLSLKAINSELERLGARAVLARGDGYFYFLGGEATGGHDLAPGKRREVIPEIWGCSRCEEFERLMEEAAREHWDVIHR